jgi:hypothetical protein
MAQVSKVDWEGGGLSPPAIGPDGRVYVLAANILFIFPPPSGQSLRPTRPSPPAIR